MTKLLDDARVGEYKYSLVVTVLSTIMLIGMLFMTSLFPFYKEYYRVDCFPESTSEVVPDILCYDSINFTLYDFLFSKWINVSMSILAILVLIVVSFVFINKIMLINRVSVMKKRYFKISKLIETVASFCVSALFIVLIPVYVNTQKIVGPTTFTFWSIAWFVFGVVLLIEYVTIKKVSIYD